jgi:hypothetical protein
MRMIISRMMRWVGPEIFAEGEEKYMQGFGRET